MSVPSVWRAEAPLVLASASAARRGLLEAAGLPVRTEVSGVDEREVESRLPPGASPLGIAFALATAKALAVSARHPDAIVIGADQVLDCEGRLFTKPADADAARRQIASLAGRTHRLRSAAIVARAGQVLDSLSEEPVLTMRDLDEATIARYVALVGEAATRSVGAYEIEGLGQHLFSEVRGSHAAILGLPMAGLLAAFRRMGYLAL